MIESDYIIRMFTLLGKALARVALRKETKEYEEAAGEVDESSKALLGLSVEMLIRLPIPDLHRLFGSDPAIAKTRFYIAGLLLRQTGELAGFAGRDDESTEILFKSLSLIFEYVPGEDDLESDRLVETADFLLLKLDDYDLPAALKEKTAAYYENRGMYAKCEDVIFQLIEEKPDFLPEAISFYERFLAKQDADLESGNLPREEVEASLSEIRSKLEKITNGSRC